MQNFASALNIEAKLSKELAEFRQKHWLLAQEQGLPTTKHEKFKYNNLKVFAQEFKPGVQMQIAKLDDLLDDFDEQSREQILQLEQNALGVLVFVNGFLAENLSQIPAELHIENCLPNMQKSQIENKNYPSLRLVDEQNRLQNLHLALLQGNYKIKVDKTLDKPIAILHFNTGVEKQAVSSSYELELGEGVAVNLMELQLGANSSLNLVLNNFSLAENSSLTMQLYNSTDKNSLYHGLSYVQQDKNSQFKLQHLNLSSGWSRQDTLADIAGENADCDASGVCFGKDKAELDLHFNARHLAGKTISKQLYKYILDDRAQGIFNSGVFVARDSQKIDSMQRSSNLLISDRAKMSAKPELEIYADDVKCAHGASTGSLDAETLFALRSRGINAADAVNIMTMAFANQVLDNLDSLLIRTLAKAKIFKHLSENSENLEDLDNF